MVGVEELATLLAVKRSWVYEHAKRGKLPCYRVGRYLRFRTSEVVASFEQTGLDAARTADPNA